MRLVFTRFPGVNSLYGCHNLTRRRYGTRNDLAGGWLPERWALKTGRMSHEQAHDRSRTVGPCLVFAERMKSRDTAELEQADGAGSSAAVAGREPALGEGRNSESRFSGDFGRQMHRNV